MSKKTIIFCISYLEIKSTLQLIHQYGENNVIIVTYIENIEKFIELVHPDISILFYSPVPYTPTIRNYFRSQKSKKQWKTYFERIFDYDIYFSHVAFGVFESYLIRLLSLKNNIYYKPEVKENFNQNRSIKARIIQFYIKWQFGVEVISGIHNNIFIPVLSKIFITSVNAKHYKLQDNWTSINDDINSKINIRNKRVLILAGGIVDGGSVNVLEYEEKTNKLIRQLMECYGIDELCVKKHPRFDDLWSIENDLDEIPSFIPAEFIVDHFELIIGYSSVVLFRAANMGKKVISTIKYYEPLQKNIVTESMSYFEVNLHKGRKIEYINSVNDLLQSLESAIEE